MAQNFPYILKKIIKDYLLDKVATQIKSTNKSLQQCNQKLSDYANECRNSGDFQKSCPKEKCQLPSPIKEKVKDSKIYDRDSSLMKIIETKLGKQNFLATVLINGLSEKKKVTGDYPLNLQKYFIENATQAMAEKYEKENLKFDSSQEAMDDTQNYLMFDNSINDSIKNFQSYVLKKATRSKAKNLELVRLGPTLNH